MEPIPSTRFSRALTQGGNPYLEINAYRAGVLRRSNIRPQGTPTITLDESAAIRRSLSVILVDEDGTLTPKSPLDALSPFGNELEVKCGFQYPDGAIETVPMGIFRIDSADPDGLGSVKITGLDRSMVIARARHETPYTITDSPLTTVAIQALISAKYPGLTFISETTLHTVPLSVYEEGDKSGDPWKNAQDLAMNDGLEIFFDVRGQVIIRRVPNPVSASAVWNYAPGTDSMLLSSNNVAEAVDARNVAIVVGEPPGAAPVRATKEITDPTSPLYPPVFGRAPIFLTSPLITTTVQAQAAADALLLRHAGKSEQLAFNAAPNPLHDAGDIVRIVDADQALDVNVVLSKFTFPLLMNAEVKYETRAKRSNTGGA